MAERNIGDMVNDICSGISFQAFLKKYGSSTLALGKCLTLKYAFSNSLISGERREPYF